MLTERRPALLLYCCLVLPHPHLQYTNQNRLAMLGFVGMLATELITHVNTLQAWGLQGVASTISSATTSVGGL